LIRFVSTEKRFITLKNHNFFVSLPNWTIQMARGAQLDGAQICLGYQDQTKNTQGARRLQSLKCSVIGIPTPLVTTIYNNAPPDSTTSGGNSKTVEGIP
jgi:hypothetical protein